jgi:hypothetical protein
MANVYKDISEFIKKAAATGTEEFQVSATEKVTAQQIADLASSGLNVYTVSESEAQNQKIDASRVEELKKSVLILFPNEVSYIPYFKVSVDNSKAYFITGSIPINSQGEPGINNGEEPPFEQVQTVMIEVDLTTRDITVWPYPVVKKEWLQTSDIIEVGDFTTINELWPASVEQAAGNVVSFYTGAEVYSQPEASETKYVGFVILDTDFANTKTATVIAYGQNTGKQYIGKLEYEAQSIDWYPLTYASRLTNAVKVTAFTESSLSSLLSSWKAGDVVPFTTDSVTASTANQFPESGIFNGFISMGSNEGDYFQIFAFKTGSNKAYLGACIGSTTQWTALGDSSEGRGPIPGYKTLVSSWSSAVTTGSTGIINFREEIPKASRILVVAQIRSSPTGSATIRANVPLTLASINDSGQGILFDLSLQYLATGTNIGSIRLICTSLITGANGVQGMNTIVQSNNLANAGDIIQLSLYYK